MARQLAIIGAGFSGSMLAAHVLHGLGRAPLDISLIERSGRFTAGVAYASRSRQHLLNVPAGRMSAFSDDPDHFLRWALRQDATISGGSFVPRMLYGQYLASILDEAEAVAATGVRLRRIGDEAVGIEDQPGQPLRIHLAGGAVVRADAAVLAIGNYPPADPAIDDPHFFAASRRYARDPWSPDALAMDVREPVLLIGTGLTMLDVAISLREQGHEGQIVAVSRRGLLPQPHRTSPKAPPVLPPPASLGDWPRTARALLRALRLEVRNAQRRGIDWREIITSIRGQTPALWQSLPWLERQRFLTHLRPFWETHRHRAAPVAALTVHQMIRAGRLQVIAGRVIALRDSGDGVIAGIRRRGLDTIEAIHTGRVINCTGPDTDLARVGDPLVRQLRAAGLIRPDPLGLGLDSDAQGSLLDAAGAPNPRLFLLGPLRKGLLWENTAVPELRAEVLALARRLAALAAPRAAPVSP